MAERISLMEHHVNMLATFLRGVPLSKVESIVRNKIISSMEDLEFEEGLAYPFLKDPDKKKELTEAITNASVAFVTNNFGEIPDWKEDGSSNLDIICKSCGNLTDHGCRFDDPVTST